MKDTITIYNKDKSRFYEITVCKNGSIWIGYDGSGEGGEFNKDKIFKLIDKFYKENL